MSRGCAAPPPAEILPRLREIHRRLLAGILAHRAVSPPEAQAGVHGCQAGDVIYALDAHCEDLLVECCEEWGPESPFLLIAEGLGTTGEQMFPAGADRREARFRMIVDPIDGTRGLMYDKRSAWILSGVAPNHGEATSLRDIVCSVMTEIPTSRARYADQLWAVRGEGTGGLTWDLATQPWTDRQAARFGPSRATDLRHGFASFARFFPGGKELTSRLEETLLERLLGPPADGTPLVFEDQYISSGGQLHELIAGRDRFVADLRPLILPLARRRGEAARLCAHPYDLAAVLIAEEAGVIVADPWGERLDAPLTVHHDVAWTGYANAALRDGIAPVLAGVLKEQGFQPPGRRGK